MSQRHWSGQIGAIPLVDGTEDAGFELDGAAAFLASWTGSSQRAFSGFKHTQYALYSYGKDIEIRFIHAPAALWDSLLDLLIPLMPSGAGVVCTFQDGNQTITGTFKPNPPSWFDRGQPDGDYIKDAVLRLTSRPPM